jgi:hypothetical protein
VTFDQVAAITAMAANRATKMPTRRKRFMRVVWNFRGALFAEGAPPGE